MDAIEKRARELLAQAFGCDPEELLPVEVRAVRAVLAYHAALTPPEGYVLVPVELPVEMEIAFMETWVLKRRCIDDPEMQDAWEAALAARPEVPT
ncbi:hypothetical protein A9K58_17410 [Stenotrophomonas maltophilia]|uniref:Uncharacterized protein n=1 Tax=Stenotrophomonas maltophilia TaxID=40324 RepID=A0A1A6XP32_STEMA|nr:hypothetical protein [Stenotrophomonas maltophilia]OBU64369.1 hypothetical protein A9K58_17410 [Stenotrophomonas maltophilia]